MPKGLIVVPTESNIFTCASGRFSWANQVNGIWKSLYSPCSCRSRLQDYWYKTKKNNKYRWTVVAPDGAAPSDDKTNLFLVVPKDQSQRVAEAIERLRVFNAREEIFGLTKTTAEEVHTADGEVEGIVFSGDPAWGSNLWKISLFSFYLKQLPREIMYSDFYDGGYMRILTPHEDKLWSKLTTEFRETVAREDYENIHRNSGFVSILESASSRYKLNCKMYNLLITDGKECKNEAS